VRKRDIPRRLLNIHVRLLLAQCLLFILLECTGETLTTYYWVTLALLIVFGVFLFPFLASRSVRQQEVRFRTYTSPGSELLQIGTCALLVSIHYDAPILMYVIAGATLLGGLALLARYSASAS
jgi:hypothetical protein